MKGDITGLCLCSSPHAMIGALILKVLLSGEERGRGREGRGREGEGGGGRGGEGRGREGEGGGGRGGEGKEDSSY